MGAARTALRGDGTPLRVRFLCSSRNLFVMFTPLRRPGWTHTGMTQSDGDSTEKPAGAWTAEQTVEYMLERVRLGDFYIIAPDNETPPRLDKLRMQWAVEDMTEGRPALSRWHPDFKSEYEEFVREGMADQRRRSPTSRME